MAALCRIELFGGLRIIRDESTISRFSTRKIAALLAYLAFHRDAIHSREALIDMLWPCAESAAGRHSLSVALSSLRHQLEPPGVYTGAVLVADRTNVHLNPEVATTDVAEFEAVLEKAGRATDKLTREGLLEEALRLYRGVLLPGFYEPWIPTEQVRLSELYVETAVELAKQLVKRSEPTAAATHLRAAITAEPLREEPYRQLIKLNMERGESGAALAIYHDLERVFAEELGEKPSATTRRLVRGVESAVQQDTTSSGSLETAFTAAPRQTQPHRTARSPTGTVMTFLLVRADEVYCDGDRRDAHRLREAVKRHGGAEIATEPPLSGAVFGRASDALDCAVTCQLQVISPKLGVAASESVATPPAIAIHTAEATAAPDDSHPARHRAERLLTAAHPAQILCSEATAGLLRYDLDGGLRLRDLGVYRLRGAIAAERVFELLYAGGPDTSSTLDAESGYAPHLPYNTTRFFGRHREIRQLENLLWGDARLVTLIGPPGCGKTRLAIEAATRLVEPFKGNVWFVPLADLCAGSEVLAGALEPLGIRRSPGATPIDQIVAALAERRALVILDNFEHMIESADEVRVLLERLPDLRCLLTSRRRLGLTGEREFPVVPLPVPGAWSLEGMKSNESVQLFVDRAQAVRPDFQLTTRNASLIQQACRRLEGVPLAIELAAAQTQSYGLRHVLDRLATGEDLITRSRDAENRHRSLRAAIAWSYSLLSPELQHFFARLSVLRDSWTAESAATVCNEPLALDYLAELSESSLIATKQPLGRKRQYRMLAMIRYFAAEQLHASGL